MSVLETNINQEYDYMTLAALGLINTPDNDVVTITPKGIEALKTYLVTKPVEAKKKWRIEITE